MSQVKLTLRPPPNVDFVHGYPGIPPGAPDRPQAAVKGAIEVRVGPQGVKAQWVRIELRKVETLPGGGQSNTYFDYVGPSPVNLWQSSDEYTMLQTQDFPFYIRIPESIPPSIALEKGAGIKYELVATVSVWGKKGFLRQRKSTVVSTMAPIIIDKHELHSTWPVYQQPESRHQSREGVNLTVDRVHTCYGPGDRVSVMATIKSENLHTVILRGFEFTLKETSVFRAGPNSKKNVPQIKTVTIGEQKVPVNATLYGGTQHKAELACVIPKDHTTTSLNAARHIDITYIISVKALMGTGTHLVMDLPVIVSNWPRAVSVEAIRRIGTAPSLSLLPPNGPGHQLTTSVDRTNQMTSMISPNGNSAGPFSSVAPSTISHQQSRPEIGAYVPPRAPSRQYSTAPTSPHSAHPTSGMEKVDEFGYQNTKYGSVSVDRPGYPSRTSTSTSSRPPRSPETRRPRSATANNNRLTIINVSDETEVQDEDSIRGPSPVQRQASASVLGNPVTPPKSKNHWPTAEEEKRRLYERARADVERVQGAAPQDDAYPSSQVVPHADTSPQPSIRTSPTGGSRWPTAEEEKARLFHQAQAVAQRTQGFSSYSPPATSHSIQSSEPGGSGSRSFSGTSPGAALYSQAISAMNRNTESTLPSVPSTRRSPSATAAIPHYPSADEEKAALRRYHEAKLAVDRTQNTGYNPGEEGAGPSAYEALYPINPPGSSSYSGGVQSPPSFTAPSTPPSALSEKERLRRAYEAQDVAAAAAATRTPPPQSHGPPVYTPPPPASSSSSNALTEKELLRRRYEAQDAEAMGQTPTQAPQTPVRGLSLTASIRSRPQPVPKTPPIPVNGDANRPLTAAEEKAQLRAKYDSESRGVLDASPTPNHVARGTPPPPPPPLMPRPPVEYIQATRAEDARMSNGNGSYHSEVGLDIRPFTPFSNGFQPSSGTPPPPPPLPTKVPFSD